MREAEQYEIPPFYVVVRFGEVTSWSTNEEDVLRDAKETITQHLCDFWRHKLPMKVTPTIIRDMDVRVYKLDVSSQVEMDVQAWVDEYTFDLEDSRKRDAELEYERFVTLRSQYEERFQRESNGC